MDLKQIDLRKFRRLFQFCLTFATLNARKTSIYHSLEVKKEPFKNVNIFNVVLTVSIRS